MALPPQAVEKLIQTPSATQGAYKQFVFLSSSLLILALVLYAGLQFGYSAYLKSSSDKLNAQIQDYAKKVSPEDSEKVANFYSQLANLGELLKNHSSASPALRLVEGTSSPDIYYNKLNLSVATNQLDLSGFGKTLEAIAAQAALLEKDPNVDRVNLTNAMQGQGNLWQFNMTVFLKPGVLRPGGAPSAPSGTASLQPPAAATSTASSTSSSTNR